MDNLIDKIVPYLQARLSDSDGQVFDIEDLKKFIRISISINAPYPDNDLDNYFKIHLESIVSYAAVKALAAHALKEKGCEFRDVTDTTLPPKLSEFLLQASQQEFDSWMRIKELEERNGS